MVSGLRGSNDFRRFREHRVARLIDAPGIRAEPGDDCLQHGAAGAAAIQEPPQRVPRDIQIRGRPATRPCRST